jgi:hypothetical protein
MNTVPIPKRLSVLFCDVLVTGSAELKEKETAGGGYKALTIEWVAQVSLLRPGFSSQVGPGRNTHSKSSAPFSSSGAREFDSEVSVR